MSKPAVRKSVLFEDKLNGRLAMMKQTASKSSETGYMLLAERHGDRLAKLVSSGNQDAIQLMTIRECYESYMTESGQNMELINRFEHAIAELNGKLGLDAGIGQEVAALVETALSDRGFNNLSHLKNNLTEGLMLSINTIGSKALSIPTGEYVVWLTDANTTTLIPTTEAAATTDQVLETTEDKYDLQTRDLLKNWNKVERVIGERTASHKAAARGSLAAAIDNSGSSQEEIASKLGVNPSTVSRWVNRGEKKGSWRNPRYDHIDGLATALRLDPDIIMTTGPAPHSREGGQESEQSEPQQQQQAPPQRSFQQGGRR